MKNTVDVPACEVFQVLEESLLDHLKRFVSFLLCIQVQSLHSPCFYHNVSISHTWMVWVLLEDLIGVLKRLLVLLAIIEGLMVSSCSDLRAFG